MGLFECNVDQTNNSKIEIFGWLVSQLVGQLVGWLVGWLVDWDLIGMKRGGNGCEATLDTGRG